MTRGARLLLLGPYVLLLMVFFTAPLLLMFAISLSRQSFGQLEWAFTLQHYVRFFTDAYYLGVLGDTLWLGALTTVASLLLGYPVAYHLALTRSRWKPLLIVFILSPLLVGIVIRCYGWMILLADRGADQRRRSRSTAGSPSRSRSCTTSSASPSRSCTCSCRSWSSRSPAC